MTPAQTTLFLQALAASGIQARACRAAGISYGAVSARKAKDADFAAAVLDAMEQAYDILEEEARRRALEGVEEPIVHQGQLTPVWERDEAGKVLQDADNNPVQARNPDGSLRWLTVRKHSDQLMQFLLKGYRKKFSTERTELTGADGGDIKVMDRTAKAARIAALMALAAKRKSDADEFGDLA